MQRFARTVLVLLGGAGRTRTSHAMALVGIVVGVLLISFGFMGSDAVEAKRISVPITINPPPDLERDQTPQDASEENPNAQRKTVVQVRRGDNMALIFDRVGIDRADLQTLVDADRNSNTLTDIYPGQALTFLRSRRRASKA